MSPHPEGGYYRETYRSAEYVERDALPARFGGRRSFSTSIYYLLGRNSFSAFHRIIPLHESTSQYYNQK